MSLKSFFISIEDDALAAIKAAGHVFESFAVGETQKLVAEVKTTDLGTTALNLINAVNSSSTTGVDKLSMVVGALVPALTKLQAGGGLAGLATSIESFALEFAQSAYNDFKTNVVSHIGSAAS